MEKKKQLYLELLRIAAVFLMIFNHTGLRGYTYYTTLEAGSVRYWICMAMAVVCNLSVSVFYMVTGVTLLGKNEPPLVIWKNRIPRILCVIFLFSLVMALFYGRYDLAAFDFGDFLRNTYSKNIIAPYWYLYAYLALLMLLPLLRRMVQNMTDTEFVYLFLLYNVFNGLIPIVQYRLSEGELFLNSSLDLGIATSRMLFYPAMGYWLSRRKTVNWRELGLLWLASVLAVAATCYITHYRNHLIGNFTEASVGKFYKSLHAFPVVTLFLTAKKLEETLRFPRWLEKAILCLGSCTFGIYLIEQILRKLLVDVRDQMALVLPNMLSTLLYIGMVFIGGFGITWCLKKLPILRKLL